MNDTNHKSELKIILERHHGRLSAINSGELSYLTGLPDRQLRLLINELIDEGMPVLSVTEKPAGYFLPVTYEEARQYTKSLRSRAIEIFIRRRKVMKNADLYLKPARQSRLI